MPDLAAPKAAPAKSALTKSAPAKSAPAEATVDPLAAVRRDRPSAPPLYDPSLTPFGTPVRSAPGPTSPAPMANVVGPGRLIGWIVLASILAASLSLAAFSAFARGGDEAGVVSLGGSQDRAAGSNLTLQGQALDVQAVLAKVRESVVTIETNQQTRRGIFGGAGSGVVVSDDGLVLTNEHVVRGVDLIEVTFFNGLTFEATLVGSSARDDIALLQVKGVTDTLAADLGSVETLRVGDEVLAIGNALGLGGEPTVTRGIVSAKDRIISEPGFDFDDLIQTDAAINPGNSGGPLVNAAGEVVGINTAIIEGAQNIGFAISIDSVLPLIERLLGRDALLTPEMGELGISSHEIPQIPPDELVRYGVTVDQGAFIVDVIAGSAAEKAGLQVGDVIVSIEGVPISSSEEVARAVRRLDPGQKLNMEFSRAGQVTEIDVTLGSRADAGN